MSTVTAVTLTRRRHPFEGRSLRVLGSMRRHGAAELLVVLPDGSKRLIPAAWTDLEQPAAGGDAASTVGAVPDLLRLSELVSCLSARPACGPEQAARKSPCKEDDRAACSAQSAAGPGSGATPGPDRASSRRAGGSGIGAAGPPDREGSRDRRESGGRR
ncbi:MAG: hypothetical protein JO181_07755 [Solirubrobacterales bacterium]|nr:hypothetical protein [Solirubrobacterales bacterium]